MVFYAYLLSFLELTFISRKLAFRGFMDTYRLDLLWTELDSLKAAVNRAIDELEKCHDMLNAKLDEPLEPALYAQYLEYLANVSRDKANMRSILCKVDLSHD